MKFRKLNDRERDEILAQARLNVQRDPGTLRRLMAEVEPGDVITLEARDGHRPAPQALSRAARERGLQITRLRLESGANGRAYYLVGKLEECGT